MTTTSPSPARSKREADGRAAIDLDEDRRVAGRARDAGEDLLEDRFRLLRARVVGRDDREIGSLGADAAHQRPLVAVAVAAAAEDADDAFAGQLSRRDQDVLERIWRVRVVDEYPERLALVDRLEPAGDAIGIREGGRRVVKADVNSRPAQSGR